MGLVVEIKTIATVLCGLESGILRQTIHGLLVEGIKCHTNKDSILQIYYFSNHGGM